jgi:hypothetical protein
MILVSLPMTLFIEKVLISNSGLMTNMIKKSWTDSKPCITISVTRESRLYRGLISGQNYTQD